MPKTLHCFSKETGANKEDTICGKSLTQLHARNEVGDWLSFFMSHVMKDIGWYKFCPDCCYVIAQEGVVPEVDHRPSIMIPEDYYGV
jgi:hypothetical protein